MKEVVEERKAFEYNHYKQDINPLRDSIIQSAYYLSIMKDVAFKKAYEHCKNCHVEQIQKVNPTINVNVRKQNGDKEQRTMTMTGYIKNVVGKYLIAPSLTTYLKPEKKVSLLSKVVTLAVATRTKYKNEYFLRKSQNAPEEETDILDRRQNNEKTTSNSISGSVLVGTISLHNPTTHSSLTSTTRYATSIANTLNERMLAGNRNYYCLDYIRSNVLSIIQALEQPSVYGCLGDSITEVVKKYSLKNVTVEDVMNCINKSASIYMLSGVIEKLQPFIVKLTQVQRNAVVYLGDLKHIREHNDEFMWNFIDSLSKESVSEDYNLDTITKEHTENVRILANVVNRDKVKGMGLNYKDMHKKGILKDIVGTCKAIEDGLEHYKDFINVMLINNNLPNNISTIHEMHREVVLISNTDSTIFSVDDWCEWFNKGVYRNTPKTYGVAGVMIMLSSELITHNLAIFSSNMGLSEKCRYMITMKNEYMWSAFGMTNNNNNHYYASTVIREGNVYKESSLEMKGVHFKSVNTPQLITEQSNKDIAAILGNITKGSKVDEVELVKKILSIEKTIYYDMKSDKPEYLTLITIKDHTAYKKEKEKSNYVNYYFWNDVFGKKYGYVNKPPYDTYRVPLLLHNKTLLNNWLDSIEDRSIAEAYVEHCKKYDRKTITSFYIPVDKIFELGSLPVELMDIINIEKTITTAVNKYYMVLESIGMTIKEGKTLHNTMGLEYE